MLKVSKRGYDFLDAPYPVMLARDHDYDSPGDEEDMITGAHKTISADQRLYSMLKDLRKQIARRKKLPPFVIFQDPSLADMSIQYPITLEELQKIQGVGQGKAKRYGREFVELIAKYVEENEIDRPDDFVVRTIANKSKMKVFIIQNIDRKLSFDDIANAKGVEVRDNISEVEALVNTGTKLNIDYYVNSVLDDDHQEEVFDYFREAEDDSVEKALDELGEDEYSEEDIRLMRIKFLSDMGN